MAASPKIDCCRIAVPMDELGEGEVDIREGVVVASRVNERGARGE